MKEKNTVTLEELDKNKAKKQIKLNYGEFFKKNILTKFWIILIIAVIITLVFIISSVNHVKSLGCTNMYCSDQEITISENYISKAEMLLITLVAAMVPYFYLPALGFVAYMYFEIVSFAHAINVFGYLSGIFRYILPFILNVVTISLITALGIYLAKIATNKFMIGRKNTMNFTRFRLRVYEMLKKQDKYDALYEKHEKKIQKLEKGAQKIQWKAVFITIGIATVIQFIAVVLQKLFI